ncbi:MAG: alpha/beta fold hydrolase, partial [Planktomarina sp.]
MLNYIEHGDGPNPPLIIAHGLFGSARNWGVIAKRLSDTRRVIAVDMRNHAGSFWDDDHSYAALGADLREVITHIGGPVDLLGHSMGGKAAMMAAVSGADIRRLIVADIAPVAYAHTQQHLIDAMRGLDLENINTRADATAQLSQVVDHPMVVSFLLQSLNMTNKTWRLNLDV